MFPALYINLPKGRVWRSSPFPPRPSFSSLLLPFPFFPSSFFSSAHLSLHLFQEGAAAPDLPALRNEIHAQLAEQETRWLLRKEQARQEEETRRREDEEQRENVRVRKEEAVPAVWGTDSWGAVRACYTEWGGRTGDTVSLVLVIIRPPPCPPFLCLF